METIISQVRRLRNIAFVGGLRLHLLFFRLCYKMKDK